MIKNVPSPEALQRAALDLYFSAWSALVKIRYDFDQTFSLNGMFYSHTGTEFNKELWGNYVCQCQQDLRSILALIQQSAEIALKARICAVSPYLLLQNKDGLTKQTAKIIDFSDLKTLDARDLPSIVNSVTNEILSSTFINRYRDVRLLRNRIVHLGVHVDPITPPQLIEILIDFYIELWPGRNWLKDRLEYRGRFGYLNDWHDWSAEADLMLEWPFILEGFPPAKFKALTGSTKMALKYWCPKCVEAACCDHFEFSEHGVKTAFLSPAKAKAKAKLKCAVCESLIALTKCECECGSSIVSILNSGKRHFCHVCSEEWEI